MMGWGQDLNWAPFFPRIPLHNLLKIFSQIFPFSLPFFSFSLKYNGGVFGSELELQGELPFSCCLFKQKLSGLFHDHYENKKTTSHHPRRTMQGRYFQFFLEFPTLSNFALFRVLDDARISPAHNDLVQSLYQ